MAISMTLDQIAELVAGSVFNESNTRLLECRKIQTPGSMVLRIEFEVEGSVEVLFLKTPVESENRKKTDSFVQGLKREQALIQRMNSEFGEGSGLEIIPTAWFIKDINGLVTPEVSGKPFQDLISSGLLLRYKRCPGEIGNLSRLAGRWLRRFHSLDLTEDESGLRKSILNYNKTRLDTIADTNGSGISASLAEALARDIENWIDQALSDVDIKIVMCHNDYSPHNMIVTEKGICVLDFSYSAPGFPAFDVACFWHKIQDMKGSLFRGSNALTQLQDCFLCGYNGTFDRSRPDVKLGLIRLTLSKMLTILRDKTNSVYKRMENKKRYSIYLSQIVSGFEAE